MTTPKGFKPNNSGPVETRLSVLSWNIWWQFGPWQERAAAIEASLLATDADVIALQEVWGDSGENYGEILAKKLRFHCFHVECMTMNGVGFGNAILSRWPIAETKVVTLSGKTETGETRNALYARIDGPRGPIDFFCTHLNWRYEQSHIRQEQVREVAEFVKANTAGKMPPILCGDFNAVSMSDEIRMLTGLTTAAAKGLAFHDAWTVAGKGEGLTWDNRNPFVAAEFEPDRRIDYIFAGHPKARGRGYITDVEIIGNAPVDGIWPSDHFGVMAKIRY
ncbi:MAG: endonuclease/exonuclease/phosphatase family protein [Rhodobacteraceae bacterium]|nr:endonuclease/exonuclease/phosphatase family protein [Paracoccaceae bacterium]